MTGTTQAARIDSRIKISPSTHKGLPNLAHFDTRRNFEMRDEDDSEIVDTQVEQSEDGSYTATMTTTDGKTGSGSSVGGVLEGPSAEEALVNAIDDAQSK